MLHKILDQHTLWHAGNNQEPVDETLLEGGPERALYDDFSRRSSDVAGFRAAHKYRDALQVIASLRPAVDLFFDKVLVKAPDQRIRENRLRLLDRILTEFSTIAGFSEIVSAE